MIIPDIKFVRKVLRVNQIPNQIHPINIPRSTPNTHRVIENHVISTIIFIVLLITPIISSLLHSSQMFAASRYPKSFDWINLERIIVKNITTIANTIFRSISVENIPRISVIKLCVCSSSALASTA